MGAPSHNTIIGHSYGSTTVGFTMRDKGLPVDKVIFVGSPGVGVDHASALGIDPSNVYVGLAENDLIRAGELLPDQRQGDRRQVFGRDPAFSKFGANHLPTDPGKSVFDGGAHSQYWDTNSKSLDAIGQVAVGQQPHA